MKNKNKIIWGIVLILLGIVFLLNRLGVARIDLLFEGWWTLFIIIPCAVSLFTEKDKWGSVIGLLVGVALLLACRGVFSFGLLWKLVLPVVLLLIGLKLLLGGIFFGKGSEAFQKIRENGVNVHHGNAVFSGNDMRVDGEEFQGAEINAIFGGVNLDLRGAVIRKDAAIHISAIFGGIEILVPPNVTVKTNVTGIFGGAENRAVGGLKDAPVLYVTGLCLFGGVEIK